MIPLLFKLIWIKIKFITLKIAVNFMEKKKKKKKYSHSPWQRPSYKIGPCRGAPEGHKIIQIISSH